MKKLNGSAWSMSFTKNLVEVIVMKKFLGLLAILMMISSSCLAMTFSQPVKLGSASATDATFNVYKVEGAIKNRNGISKFGSDEDSIYFYQRPATTKYCYGGDNMSKTFQFTSAYGCDFTQIKSDISITFYMVHEWEFSFAGEKYILLGKLSDGSWVKYFDTRDLTEKYFGKPKVRDQIPYYKTWHCDGDTVVIVYQRIKDKKFVNEGEFRFKWDNKAQWFGVEQVIY